MMIKEIIPKIIVRKTGTINADTSTLPNVVRRPCNMEYMINNKYIEIRLLKVTTNIFGIKQNSSSMAGINAITKTEKERYSTKNDRNNINSKASDNK